MKTQDYKPARWLHLYTIKNKKQLMAGAEALRDMQENVTHYYYKNENKQQQ